MQWASILQNVEMHDLRKNFMKGWGGWSLKDMPTFTYDTVPWSKERAQKNKGERSLKKKDVVKKRQTRLNAVNDTKLTNKPNLNLTTTPPRSHTIKPRNRSFQ